jgi:hypothetical protein
MCARELTKQVDRSTADRYRRVAISLQSSAVVLREVADGDSGYGNAIGVLAIHAAIAWCDTLCIAFGARKSTGSHDRAPSVLQEVLGNKAEPKQLKTLRAVIGEKDRVSYTGDVFSVKDGAKLLAKVEDFAKWAAELYERRPPAR